MATFCLKVANGSGIVGERRFSVPQLNIQVQSTATPLTIIWTGSSELCGFLFLVLCIIISFLIACDIVRDGYMSVSGRTLIHIIVSYRNCNNDALSHVQNRLTFSTLYG